MSDPVDPQALTRGLADTSLGPVEWSAATSSTNDALIEMARDGSPEGLVLGADHQRAGRGRLGRSWVDRPGDCLAMSVLLRPPPTAPASETLPILAGVAVADAIGPDAHLAWPNDVLVRDRKVCGILCEAGARAGTTGWVVVGIGVNVRGEPEVGDARWAVGALDADGPAPSRQDLALGILLGVATRYATWLEAGPAGVLAEWERRDRLTGNPVAVEAPGGTISGTAAGIDSSGRLLVMGEGGVVAVASAASVRLGG